MNARWRPIAQSAAAPAEHFCDDRPDDANARKSFEISYRHFGDELAGARRTISNFKKNIMKTDTKKGKENYIRVSCDAYRIYRYRLSGEKQK